MRELFSARELEEIRLADLEIDGRPRNRVPAQSIIRLPIEHRDSMDRKRFRNMGQQIMALYRGNEGADSMSETKVVVPPEMLKAAINEFFKAGSLNGRATLTDVERLTYAIEAALRWLDGELQEMCWSNHYEGKLSPHAAMIEVWREGVADVRRMFRVPEPEAPESERAIIDAWLRKHQPRGSRVSLVGDTMAQELIDSLEAYRRGLRDK